MRHNLNYIQQNGMPRYRGFNLLQKFRADNGTKSVIFPRANMPYEEEDFHGHNLDRELLELLKAY